MLMTRVHLKNNELNEDYINRTRQFDVELEIPLVVEMVLNSIRTVNQST